MSSCDPLRRCPGAVRTLVLCALTIAMPAVEVVATGTVVIDSGATVQVNGPAKEQVISWRAPDGSQVQAGDVLLRFDTTLVERQLLDRRRGAEMARIEHERQVASRAAEVEALEAERRKLRAELAVAKLAIALAEERDPQRSELLRADVAAARLAAAIAVREAERIRVEFEQGRVSELAAAEAQRNAGAAQLAIAKPELALAEDERPSRTPVELAALRLKAEELAVRLGLKEDGSEDSGLGIGARIVASRTQGEADLATRRIDLERIESELKESERDVLDRTPLVGVEVAAVGSAEPLVRVAFLPGRSAAQPGWSADHGGERRDGRGWDRALGADELILRQPAARGGPPEAVARPGGERPRGNRKRPAGQGGGSFSGGVALISRPAQWSLPLAPGRYAVTVALGDDRSWDGAAVRVEGQALALPPRLGPGRSEHRIEVQVDDGSLDLRIGDGETKALRAEKSGTIVWQGHARIGFRVNDPSWSLGFLAAPESRLIDLLVPQELAPLLMPGRKAAAGSAPLAERIALGSVTIRRRDGSRLPATVASVGAQNVRNEPGERAWDSGNPADAIAREVRLKPEPSAGGRLVQGETVEVLFDFALPAATSSLPPHLVRIDRDGAAVRVRGAAADQAVEALRLGAATVVAAELDPAQLALPMPRQAGPVADAQGRFRGEVVPGARTRVALHWIWGRVESLVEDGSQVQAGDIVLSVYNPQMEADRDKIERERRAAVQRVVAAAERRRQDLVRAKGDHDVRRVAEATARLRLRRHLDDDPLGREDLAMAVARAADGLAAAADRRQRLSSLAMADPDDVAKADHALAVARLDRDRAALTGASWELRFDWLAGCDLAATWNDAVTALARRDDELAEAAVQERINTLADRIAMERAVEGDWWQRNFATRRQLKAPVAGRILFQTGWNDQTQRSEKIGREFPVWGGMTVAEIVDEQTLRFTTELPEDRFPTLAADSSCEIEFEAAPGRPVQGRFSELGRAFLIPRDRLVGDADETVSNRRAFSAVISFTPPDDLRRRLSTGAKGWVRLP